MRRAGARVAVDSTPAPEIVQPWRCELAGERVDLHGERALYWPARRRLLIADLHLGKADTFRRAGIALPRGGTAHDLGRLSALLSTTAAESLWVLGDLLHGDLVDTRWRADWDAWRARWPRTRIAILTGNHDRALTTSGLDVERLGPRIDDGPFALRHAPERHDRLHVLCGHLHPVVAPPGLGKRWPAFWLRDGLTILPAFSAFTGGVAVAPAEGETVVACVEGTAIRL